MYGAGAIALGLIFLGYAVAVIRDVSERSARRMFPFSILYLFLIFVLLLVDQSLPVPL